MKYTSNLIMCSIEREKAGIDYRYSKEDREILDCLFEEINTLAATDFHYLAELAAYNIQGVGEIVKRYIRLFHSESVRAYLLGQMVNDKVKNCDMTLLELYLDFKASDNYISKPGESAPAHIVVRYDNAFKQLKPKRIKKELLELAYCPRDVAYLPFTMRMLAGWKIPEMKELLIKYLDDSYAKATDFGLPENLSPDIKYFPPFEVMRRDLKFIAIDGLRHYPSIETVNLIEDQLNSGDQHIRKAALKALNQMKNTN